MASPCSRETEPPKQRRVGLLYDDRMCRHTTPGGADHPECADRIQTIWKKLETSGLVDRCLRLDAKVAEEKYIHVVHSKEHVKLIRNISSKQYNNRKRAKVAERFNSIYFNSGSSEAAFLAAGCVTEAVEKVAQGDLNSAFAIVRPPGHHAEEKEPMGFCLFNNVAVAASYILNERSDLGIGKILIVDWDVHHGNATQKMFWEDPRVLFFSVHRHENGSFYPGTDDGSHTMIGEGAGAGYNINVPWEHDRIGDSDYIAVWDHILIPVARNFSPDLIIVSAGFDAAIDDPLGGCCVSPYGYSIMLTKLMEFAKGRIVLALEGGYNLMSLAESTEACVKVLLEGQPILGSTEEFPFASTWRVIEMVRRMLSTHWPILADEISHAYELHDCTSTVAAPLLDNYEWGKVDLEMISDVVVEQRRLKRKPSAPAAKDVSKKSKVSTLTVSRRGKGSVGALMIVEPFAQSTSTVVPPSSTGASVSRGKELAKSSKEEVAAGLSEYEGIGDRFFDSACQTLVLAGATVRRTLALESRMAALDAEATRLACEMTVTLRKELEDARSMHTAEVDRLETELQTARATHSNVQACHKRDIDQLQAQLQEIEKNCPSSDEVTRLKAENEEWQKKYAELSATAQAAKFTLAEKVVLQSEVEMLKRKLATVMEENSQIKEKFIVPGPSSEACHLYTRSTTLEIELNLARAEKEKYRYHARSALSKVSASDQMVKELKDKLEKANMTSSLLRGLTQSACSQLVFAAKDRVYQHLTPNSLRHLRRP